MCDTLLKLCEEFEIHSKESNGSESVHKNQLSDIPPAALSELLTYFQYTYSVQNLYRTKPRSDATVVATESILQKLFHADYHISTLCNVSGEYCETYPPTLIVPECERTGPFASHDPPLEDEKINDTKFLSSLFFSSRFGRVHGRFVIPILIVRGRNICRSSTLSLHMEAIYNHVTTKTREFMSSLWFLPGAPRSQSNPMTSSFPTSIDTHRHSDELLLKRLKVLTIYDLMVEHQKKKMGIALTSSEKSERSSGHYLLFSVHAIPYPGCEFFREYFLAGHRGRDLFFNWQQSSINSVLTYAQSRVQSLDLVNGDSTETTCHTACKKYFQPNAAEEILELASQADSSSEAISSELLSSREGSVSVPVNPAPGTLEETEAEEIEEVKQSVKEDLKNGSTPLPMELTEPEASNYTNSTVANSESKSQAEPVFSRDAESDENASSLADWRNYRSWDLVTLTQNYLLIILSDIAQSPSKPNPSATPLPGIDIHCISGWDRTPLFISLVRLSLWADNECHRSLNAAQILFLTLGYDWMLFTHHLNNRVGKGEAVMYFCFDFLQYITSHQFSLKWLSKRKTNHLGNGNGNASSVSVGPKVAPKQSNLTALIKMDKSNGSKTNDPNSLPGQRNSTASTSSPKPIPLSSSPPISSSEIPTSHSFTATLIPQATVLIAALSDEDLLGTSNSDRAKSYFHQDGVQSNLYDNKEGDVKFSNRLGDDHLAIPRTPSPAIPIPKSRFSGSNTSNSSYISSFSPPVDISMPTGSPQTHATPIAKVDRKLSRNGSWTELSLSPSDALQPLHDSSSRETNASSFGDTSSNIALVVEDSFPSLDKQHEPKFDAIVEVNPHFENRMENPDYFASKEDTDSEDSEAIEKAFAERCRRLMEVRALFIACYQQSFPSTIAAKVDPNSPLCPHYKKANQFDGQLKSTITR